MENAVTLLEWSGAVFGLIGAFLLATHSHLSKYGWLAYLLANITMASFALLIDRRGLLIQQIGFTATTLLGLYRCGTFQFRGNRLRRAANE